MKVEVPMEYLKKLLRTSSMENESETGVINELDESTRETLRATFESALTNAGSFLSVESIMFSLDEAIDAVAQVKLDVKDMLTPRGTMLGKRAAFDTYSEESRNQDLKSRTRCRACKKIGHWFQDREECRQIMNERRRNAEEKRKSTHAGNEKSTETIGKDSETDKLGHDISEKGSFFV